MSTRSGNVSTMQLNKRQFLQAAAAFGGTAWFGIGCDSGDDGQDSDSDVGGTSSDPDGTGGGCDQGATDTQISSNHGHSLVVPATDIVAGATKSYSIRGTSDHDHSVTLTATHFASLAAGESVGVSSTEGPHTHSVTISCA